ncbi:CPBP family intramembrane glutamic endopeptidase [Nostoc sp.]|uniref:CPBP family intramembrane glutamic endopeptidase n=1 Tax=Nostoc sp. TaxID=1180 RepID=UPI002FF93362
MPRQKLQKILFMIAVCILNPITEELIFRGVLVHQLGIYINNYYLAIVLGLFVSVGNHIYQGRLHIITHIIFYIFTVTLLYSDVGLVGSIGFHLAGDIYPFMWLKYQVNNYKKRRREERRAKYVSN